MQEEQIQKIQQALKKWMSAYRKKHPDTERTILFLDFDGVINTYQREGVLEIFTGERSGKEMMNVSDPTCIQNLNQLLEEFPMEIVISSSWRGNGLEYCQDYLYHCGLNPKNSIIDLTPVDGIYPRQDEISSWIRKHHNFSRFLVLDDVEMECFKGYQVTTEYPGCFDAKALRKAMKLLKNQSQ